MKMPKEVPAEMIACCGINCLACSANLANKCTTCHSPVEKQKRASCNNCEIRNCAIEKGNHWCFECDDFPCDKTKSLFKRYQKIYHLDLAKDGLEAKNNLPSFLEAVKIRYTCSVCGGVIDLHHQKCSECNHQLTDY